MIDDTLVAKYVENKCLFLFESEKIHDWNEGSSRDFEKGVYFSWPWGLWSLCEWFVVIACSLLKAVSQWRKCEGDIGKEK